MALVLKQDRTIKQNASEIYLYESTQDYINDPNGGWGVTTTEGTNPDRADRAVLAFCIFTNEDDEESYLEMKDQYIGSETSYAVADGDGLINTDMSKFTILTPADGHHAFYTIPIERYSTGGEPGSPAEYYTYYNITDAKVYMYYNSAYVELAETHLQYLKSNSDAKVCHQLIDVRIGVSLATDTLDAVDTDYQGSADSRAREKWFDIWDVEDRQKTAQLSFYGNAKAVARDKIKTLTNR